MRRCVLAEAGLFSVRGLKARQCRATRKSERRSRDGPQTPSSCLGRDRPRRADHRHPDQPGWGIDLCAAAVVLAAACRPRGSTQRADLMKRTAAWAFYGVGALAILYLALYAYAVFTARDLAPADPIHIFRKPDAPNYSFRAVTILTSLRANGSRECAPDDRFRETIQRQRNVDWIASSPASPRNDHADAPVTPSR